MTEKKTINVTSDDFDSKVLTSDVPVLVDFWAEWCGPCKVIGPTLEELAGEFDGRVTVAKVNVDHHPEIAAKYGVQGIPTLILFAGGKTVDQVVGALPKRALADWLESRTSQQV